VVDKFLFHIFERHHSVYLFVFCFVVFKAEFPEFDGKDFDEVSRKDMISALSRHRLFDRLMGHPLSICRFKDVDDCVDVLVC